MAAVMALGVTVAVSTFASTPETLPPPGVVDENDQAVVGEQDPSLAEPTSTEQQLAQTTAYQGKKVVTAKDSEGQSGSAVAGELLVEIADPVKVASLQGRLSATAIPNTYRVSIPEHQDPAQAAVAFTAQTGITEVEPNHLIKSTGIPNDKLFEKRQWNLRRVNAPGAWKLERGRPGVVVAVIDTGINLSHSDLQGREWINDREVEGNSRDDDNNGYIDDRKGIDLVHLKRLDGKLKDDNDGPADDFGHGTAVASIISSNTNNGRGIAGLSWEGKLMPVKVLDEKGRGTSESLAAGIRYAADNGASVINMSLGAPTGSKTVRKAIEHAHSKNVVIVVASGNDGKENKISFPARADHVIAVGAYHIDGQRARYSNGGKQLSVVAPSSVIGAFYKKNAYTRPLKGTSFAAPHVAGLAALLRSIDANLSPNQVQKVIEGTAGNKGTRNDLYGYGKINAEAAVSKIKKNTGGSGGGGGGGGGQHGTVTVDVRRDLVVDVTVAPGSCQGGDRKKTNGKGKVKFEKCRAGADQTVEVQKTVAKAGKSYTAQENKKTQHLPNKKAAAFNFQYDIVGSGTVGGGSGSTGGGNGGGGNGGGGNGGGGNGGGGNPRADLQVNINPNKTIKVWTRDSGCNEMHRMTDNGGKGTFHNCPLGPRAFYAEPVFSKDGKWYAINDGIGKKVPHLTTGPQDITFSYHKVNPAAAYWVWYWATTAYNLGWV